MKDVNVASFARAESEREQGQDGGTVHGARLLQSIVQRVAGKSIHNRGKFNP